GGRRRVSRVVLPARRAGQRRRCPMLESSGWRIIVSQNPQPAARRTNFDRLFSPRGIALVGASANTASVGGQPLRFLTEFGYRGRVYPVNPKYRDLKGLTCYPDLSEVPDPCDVALIVVGARHVPGVIDQCGRRGIPFAIVLSAGFQEIGSRGEESQRALEAARARNTVRIVGPNCI